MQSNLKEMWTKKEKKGVQSDNGEAKMAAGPSSPSTKRRKVAPTQSASPPLSRVKKRRTVIEDEEDDDGMDVDVDKAGTESAKPLVEAMTKLKTSSTAKPDKATSKPKVPAVSSAVATKRKAKAKAQPVAPVEEDEDVEVGGAKSSDGEQDPSAAAVAEDKEEEEDEGEEELDEEKGETASKAAELALEKLKEVDLNGGWKPGDPVPYAALAHVFSLIEATTKRLEITALLTAFLLLLIQRRAPNDNVSLLQAVYLCINRLCPDYQGLELGIGESLLVKAIAESTGRSKEAIKADLKKEGDLGLVAHNSKGHQKTLFKPKPLTLPFVFARLTEIAMTTGGSSQAKKISIITKLLAACQTTEAKYIIRSLEGKLRIRLAERTVVVALAHAFVLAEGRKVTKDKEMMVGRLEEGAAIVKSVYSELPSYDHVIPALLEDGVSGLRERCKLTPGIPLKPMLAKPTKAIGEVLDRFEGKKFTCEYKYDGERAQVHRLENGDVKVFSRNSEDMSKKYPDLVEQLPRCFKESTKSFVLDAEAVAIDKDTGKLLPFQELSRRKRKDVKVEDIQVRVCLFGFDLLFLNGEPLLQKTLEERRALLREHFQVVPGEFAFAKSSDGETTEEIQTFLEESVKDGCEGLMVKMLTTDESNYEPSRRSVNWLKLKKDYLQGVGDSLDLVVIGGYYGKGKRTNVYGAFLLACYDDSTEEYQTICKIGTGFSDEALAKHYAELKDLEVEKVRGDVKVGGAKPDVWFEPKIVWEVLTADLSLSPIYTAAQGVVDERGISLRFPRFIRVRDDKSVEDATGPEQLAEMYERQALAQTKGGGKKKRGKDAPEDDFW